MFQTCPKCGHRRDPSDDPGPVDQCAACGLVYAKWLKALVADATAPPPVFTPARDRPALWAQVLGFLVPDRQISRAALLGYAVLFAGLGVWGAYFISLDIGSNEIGRSFMHNINLVFHEAGHIFFMPFGRLMMFLGGSLFQVLLPLLLGGAFLVINRDAFGAAVCLWWAGQSLMDVAPYIADARALRLPLLGGGTGIRPSRQPWTRWGRAW